MPETPRLVRALRGEPAPSRPVWLMRQAGRYLPEYRELRRTHPFRELAQDAELAATVTLMPVKRYPLDAAIVFADIMSPLAGLGVDFDFDPGPVIANPIRDEAGVEALAAPDPDRIAPEVMAAIRSVRAELPPDVAVVGFCGAPWTLAAYLVEGRGAKDFPALRAFAAARPDLLDRLLGRLTDAMAVYLVRQAQSGADVLQVFDSWGGLLSRSDWDRLIRPHLKTLLEKTAAAGAPRILFVQNAPHLLDGYADLPAEALSLDWRTDLGAVQRRYCDRAVQGNLDPAVLLAGPGAVRRATAQLLADVAPRGHVVNLGHGVLPGTPLASVEALVETVREERLP